MGVIIEEALSVLSTMLEERSRTVGFPILCSSLRSTCLRVQDLVIFSAAISACEKGRMSCVAVQSHVVVII